MKLSYCKHGLSLDGRPFRGFDAIALAPFDPELIRLPRSPRYSAIYYCDELGQEWYYVAVSTESEADQMHRDTFDQYFEIVGESSRAQLGSKQESIELYGMVR